MKHFSKIFIIKFYLVFCFFLNNYSLADNHNIYETLEQIQKDIQTLEKAVYSGSVNSNNNELNNSNLLSNSNSEDVPMVSVLAGWFSNVSFVIACCWCSFLLVLCFFWLLGKGISPLFLLAFFFH